MTDDEAAYIEAKGWKASVVPEPSIHPPLRELLWIKRRSFEVRHARRRLPAEFALMSAARGNAVSFCSARSFPSLTADSSVVAMASSILVLFLLPWLDTSRVRSARFRPVFQPFFSVVGRCGATRVRSDSSRLRLERSAVLVARLERFALVASADGQASKLRPLQCQGSPRHQFSRQIKTKRPLEARSGARAELEQSGFAVDVLLTVAVSSRRSDCAIEVLPQRTSQTVRSDGEGTLGKS